MAGGISHRQLSHGPLGKPGDASGAVHAFEYLVEGRDKGSTVVRWVHSGFLGDNWEKEYEGLSEGDPMYFDKLRVYLTYFRGRKAIPVNVFGGAVVPDREEAWATFHRGLGLAGPPQLGDRVGLTPEGLPQLDGEVDERPVSPWSEPDWWRGAAMAFENRL